MVEAGRLRRPGEAPRAYRLETLAAELWRQAEHSVPGTADLSINPIPTDTVASLLGQLSGLAVSTTWRGYGSAIFLELGELRLEEGKRHRRGMASIMLEWDWRVQQGATIAFGSSSDDEILEGGLRSLTGATVERLTIEGVVPELVLTCSDGRCVRSCACAHGQPRWTVFLPDGAWLFAEDGRVMREESRGDPLERSA